ncbi:ATP-binding protein [Pelomyxa schiedti]|nr:ATP-binding protein [Pelomyxa schiedti]
MGLFILITGPSGSGKTTLSHKLGSKFSLPVFNKDDIKELLFGHYGTATPALLQTHNEATIALLLQIARVQLASGRPFVVESNFRREFVQSVLLPDPCFSAQPILQIHCTADVGTLLRRVALRASERHPGHRDAEGLASGDLEAKLRDGVYGPADVVGGKGGCGGGTLLVDTTDYDAIDYTSLYEAVERFLSV